MQLFFEAANFDNYYTLGQGYREDVFHKCDIFAHQDKIIYRNIHAFMLVAYLQEHSCIHVYKKIYGAWICTLTILRKHNYKYVMSNWR